MNPEDEDSGSIGIIHVPVELDDGRTLQTIQLVERGVVDFKCIMESVDAVLENIAVHSKHGDTLLLNATHDPVEAAEDDDEQPRVSGWTMNLIKVVQSAMENVAFARLGIAHTLILVRDRKCFQVLEGFQDGDFVLGRDFNFDPSTH